MTNTDPRDRPEIEVTERMISAGLDALVGYDPAWDNDKDVVARIFTAMLAAAETPKASGEGSGNCARC